MVKILNPDCSICSSKRNYKIGWDPYERKEIRICLTCGNTFKWKYVRKAKRLQNLLNEIEEEIEDDLLYEKIVEYILWEVNKR